MGENSSQRPRDTLHAIVAWAVAGLLFWRALWWVTETAISLQQIGLGAMILLFGLVFLLRENPESHPLTFRFDRGAANFYAGACVAAIFASLFHLPLLLLIALGILAGAVLLFVFGDVVLRFALGTSIAFAGFAFFVKAFPFADWPLRLLAGKTALWFLDILGRPVQLGLEGNPPRLILINGGRPFEVAAECNGFGIISGCALLAVLLVFSRRVRLLDKIVTLALAPLLGFFANALRILLIVLLAPAAGRNYYIMHEAVGMAVLFVTMVAIWWLVADLPDKSAADQMKSDIS